MHEGSGTPRYCRGRVTAHFQPPCSQVPRSHPNRQWHVQFILGAAEVSHVQVRHRRASACDRRASRLNFAQEKIFSLILEALLWPSDRVTGKTPARCSGSGHAYLMLGTSAPHVPTKLPLRSQALPCHSIKLNPLALPNHFAEALSKPY